MARRKKVVVDPELANLPMHIYKQPNGQWMNVKTGEKIAVRDLHKHLPLTPEENLAERRWDLKYQ